MKETTRFALFSVAVAILFIISLCVSYYESINFSKLSEDAYVNYSTISFLTFVFAVIFLVVDIILIASSLLNRKRKSQSRIPPRTDDIQGAAMAKAMNVVGRIAAG